MTDLLADERRRQILQRIRSTGMVRVAELANELSVAEETVRRDLKLMDQKGILVRTHGGALANVDASAEPRGLLADLPFDQRRRAMFAQKRAIAAEALERVGPSATVALDGSTTAWELAALLIDPSLTVVTNSLMIITSFAARPGPNVISVGGSLDRKLMMFTGMIALDALRHLHVDHFFFSCGGIDAVRGLSDPSEAGAHFKRQLMQRADRTILLADSTKFQTRASVVFASPDDIDEVITDDGAPDDVVQQLETAGVTCSRVRSPSLHEQI